MRSEGNAPKSGEPSIWFLLHDNAPAYRSVLVKYFLAKNNLTALEHPPYSPYLISADIHLFPLG
jgi:hypothetical protein